MVLPVDPTEQVDSTLLIFFLASCIVIRLGHLQTLWRGQTSDPCLPNGNFS